MSAKGLVLSTLPFAVRLENWHRGKLHKTMEAYFKTKFSRQQGKQQGMINVAL
jgi:hypothetical protein